MKIQSTFFKNGRHVNLNFINHVGNLINIQVSEVKIVFYTKYTLIWLKDNFKNIILFIWIVCLSYDRL